MIRNNLLKTVTLPYPIIKGSFESRQQKAGQFTHKIMGDLSGQLDEKGISMSKLGRSLKKELPDNLKVFVKKNKDTDCYAQLNRTYTKDNWIVNQSLELKPDENNKITVLSIPTITHEIRHLADSLFHPKILSREQLLAKKGLDTDKFYNFYDNEVYIKEMNGGKNTKKRIIKDIKNKAAKALKGYSTEDKVNMLQYIRYSLISERNAYKEEQKIAKKLYKKNSPVYEDALYDQTKEYMFDEKIKLFKDMALDLIKKERGIHKAKLKKSNPFQIPKLDRSSEGVEFFGVDSAENIQSKLENHMTLSWLKRKEQNILEFPPINTNTAISSKNKNLEKGLKLLDTKKVGRLTVSDKLFGKNGKEGTHTIGLFKNENQLYIIDSISEENNKEVKKFHQTLKQILGVKDVIFTTKPQQSLEEYTCNNWTHANLDAILKHEKNGNKKWNKETLHSILPNDINKILEEQQEYINNKLSGRNFYDMVSQEYSKKI